MKVSQAHRRYFKNTAISMVFYLISVFAASLTIKNTELPQALQYIIAFTPALFVWWFMWGAVRYFRECDEYEQSQMIKAILFSMTVLMIFSSGWGFVELLADAPAFPVFYVFPAFCVLFGLGRYLVRAPGESC